MVELANSRVVGFDTLIRRNLHEAFRDLPNEYIATSEEANLILPIGHKALRRRCAIMKS